MITLATEMKWADWQSIINTDNDIDETVNRITSIILNATDNNIPNKIVTIRPHDIPCMTNKIRKLIRKRKKADTKAKQMNTELSWQQL
jgi:hypothetical protein